jgi:hypothetical protein
MKTNPSIGATAVVLFASVFTCQGKKLPLTPITVIGDRDSYRTAYFQTPGTNGTSTASCNTAPGTTGQVNCTMVTTPGRPASTNAVNIPQVEVFAVDEMDGSHITLWCQRGLRTCSSLQKGEYQVEQDGDVYWVHAQDAKGKKTRIKFHNIGAW